MHHGSHQSCRAGLLVTSIRKTNETQVNVFRGPYATAAVVAYSIALATGQEVGLLNPGIQCNKIA